jgi:polyhydroxyalkanoate synthesis regulator phasin
MSNIDKVQQSIDDLYKLWGDLRERITALEAKEEIPSPSHNSQITQAIKEIADDLWRVAQSPRLVDVQETVNALLRLVRRLRDLA